MKRLLTVLNVLVAGVFLAACASTDPDAQAILQDPWNTIRVPVEEAIRIAVVAPTSSDLLTSEAQEIVRGSTLAAERRGFVRGFSIELVQMDSGCSADQGAEAATLIAADPTIVGAVGMYCSDACQAAVPLLADTHVPLVSPGCAAGLLTDEVTHSDPFLRTMHADTREGFVAAEFAYNELGARRAYVIGDGSLSSNGLIEAFNTEFLELGGVIVDEATVSINQTRFGGLITEVQLVSPDVVYAPLLTQTSAALISAQNATTLNRIPHIGAHFSWTTTLMEASSVSDSSNVYATGSHLTSANFDELVSAYVQRFAETPTSSTFAYAFDAMNLLLQGIETASTVTRQDLVLGRRALRDALYETAGYPAITGSLTCTEWGDCSAGSVAVGHISNGQWQVVYVP